MATLRVGDIEIRDGDVRIQGRTLTVSPPRNSALAGLGTETTSRGEGLELLNRLPVRPAWLMASGATLAVGGILAVLLAGGPIGVLTFIFGGGLCISTGAGLAALGFLKHRVQGVSQQRRRLQVEAELAPVMARLKAALATGQTKPTVESLVADLALPEAAVVRSLIHLRDEGVVREELDLDTGNWFYSLNDTGAPAPRDLNSRLKDIERSVP